MGHMATQGERRSPWISISKRVRPWERCDDVEELKKMLFEKDEQLAKKDAQLTELQPKLKSAKKQTASSSAESAHPLTTSRSKPLTEFVSELKMSIRFAIINQMVYKPSAESGLASLDPIELFGTTESVIEALVGEEIFRKASVGPKQLNLHLSNEDLGAVFASCSLVKILRYGATLVVSDGLTFQFTRSDRTLEISGSYRMG